MMQLFSFIVLVLGILLGSVAEADKLGNVPGFIKNTLSGKCIDGNGIPATANGAQLQLWDCEISGFHATDHTITDQKWQLTQTGFIVNMLSGKCIDVDGAPATANGARLQLWDCEFSGFNASNNSPTDQRWEVTAEGFIKNTLSGKCIDVNGSPGTANGVQLQLWDCEYTGFNANDHTPTDQRWESISATNTALCPSDVYNNSKLSLHSVEVADGLGGVLRYKVSMALQPFANPMTFVVDKVEPLQ